MTKQELAEKLRSNYKEYVEYFSSTYSIDNELRILSIAKQLSYTNAALLLLLEGKVE